MGHWIKILVRLLNRKLHHISFSLFYHFPKFPTLVHFNHDITSSNKFSGNIQLRKSWPLTIFLNLSIIKQKSKKMRISQMKMSLKLLIRGHTLNIKTYPHADGFIRQNVDAFEVDAVGIKNLSSRVQKSALRKQFRSLHEKNDRICVND